MALSGEGGRRRYDGMSIALHWTTALLIVANLLLGFFADELFRGAVSLHKSIGLTVLALGVARLVWRLLHPAPPLLPSIRPWERVLARANHVAFYLLIILLPLSGWVFTSAGSRKFVTSWFGLFTVPPIVHQDPALSDAVFERHGQLAWIMVALLALHVAGALKHRFVDRDATLDRMLPGSGAA